MTRRVQLILLCEDQQQSAFMRRFLVEMGWDKRKIRTVPPPAGKGSGESHVRVNFPKELKEYRSRRSRVQCRLAVMIDGDKLGVESRIRQLDDECRDQNVGIRTNDDMVAIFVPTWEIETWLAYLGGSEVVESCGSYPRLRRAGDCGTHARELAGMCRGQGLRPPAPPSLTQACREYERLQQ